MKKFPRFFCSLVLAAGLTAGCGHLDLTPQDNPDRVLTGTVDFEGPMALPDDAVVLVRVIDAVPPSAVAQNPGDQTLKHPVLPPDQPPEVLGEKTIEHPGALPVSYRVEYTATAEQLRHGLNVEARISYGGKVRYANFNHYAIGPNDATEPHTVMVNEVR